jgi:transposase
VTQNQLEVHGAIDTHSETHHVAVIDALGRRLDDIQAPATPAGYRRAVKFLQSRPKLASVGIECTGHTAQE